MTYMHIKALNVFGNVPGCTQYGIANYFMAKYTTNATSSFMNICSRCKTYNNPTDYCPYIVTMTPEYLSNILRLNPLRVQMLSFLDILILLEDHQYGFVSSQISDTSLLNSPMLCGDNAINDETFFEGLVDDLQPLLEKNLSDNPWFSIYLTNFEKTNDRSTSMCVLSTEVVQSILEKGSVGTRPVDDEDTNATVESLSLLLNVGEKEPANHNKDYFFVGNLISRINLKTEQLHVRPYQLRTALGPNITLEVALFPFLFPFLFPQGNGAYDGRISIHDYLKYRMTCLFSPFTLYKPYLLLMYDIRQSILILKSVSEFCLQKDIVAQQKKTPNATEAQLIEKVIKYKLPESLTGSPCWHRAQLYDLLTMVDTYELPHIFLTLTSDETSELRWGDIFDLESIIKTFGDEFNWKDCPVECTYLFHAWVIDFLQKYILCKDNGILGQVQHHVIRYEVHHRLSLHAHIIFWLHPEDLASISNDIMAYIPAVYDEATKTFTEPSDSMEQRLFKLVVRKQVHSCRKRCYTNVKGCKYGFPFSVNETMHARLNPYTQRWEYSRPRHCDRNVVLYHATLLLL
jgi:hypothetical protein